MVQARFHNHKKIQSPSRTLNAMNAGYEVFTFCTKPISRASANFFLCLSKALDLIHFASQGDQHETKRLSALLAEGQRKIECSKVYQRERTKTKLVKPLSKKEKRKQETQAFERKTAQRHPDATAILSRPRPVISGKRRVPVFVNARGVPFLRIKKPQPLNLSGVIRSKLDNRWRRIERRDSLEVALTLARGEDLWDELTLGGQEEDSWQYEVHNALKAVNNKIRDTDLKNKKMAEDMWKVVLAERKLAAEEAAEGEKRQMS